MGASKKNVIINIIAYVIGAMVIFPFIKLFILYVKKPAETFIVVLILFCPIYLFCYLMAYFNSFNTGSIALILMVISIVMIRNDVSTFLDKRNKNIATKVDVVKRENVNKENDDNRMKYKNFLVEGEFVSINVFKNKAGNYIRDCARPINVVVDGCDDSDPYIIFPSYSQYKIDSCIDELCKDKDIKYAYVYKKDKFFDIVIFTENNEFLINKK